MALNVVAAVMQVLQPELVTKFATALGIDRAAALKVVSAAVPAILGGFSRKATSAEGAGELGALLSEQDPALLAKLGDTLGGSGRDAFLKLGMSLLERVLGGSGRDVLIRALTKYTGLEPQKVAGLIAIIVPIVTNILASYQKSNPQGAAGLAKQLVAQQANIKDALPTPFAALLAAPSDDVAMARPRMIASGTVAAATSTAAAAAAAAGLTKSAASDNAADLIAETATDATAALKAEAAKSAATIDAAVAAAGSKIVTEAPLPVAAKEAPLVPDKAAAASRPAVAVATAGPASRQMDIATPDVGPPPTGHPTPRQENGVKAISAPTKPAPVAKADREPQISKPNTTASESTSSSEATANVPIEPIRERRRRLPVAAWLLPLLVIIAGAGWWVQQSMQTDSVIGEAQAKRVAEQKVAEEARLKVEAEVAAKQKQQMADAQAAAARLKAETDAAQAKSAAEATARPKAQTETAEKMAADAEAKRKADAEATRLAAETDKKRVADAEAAASRVAAEAEAKRKAELEATKLASEAESKRLADAQAAAQKVAAQADAKRKAEADARVAQTASVAADKVRTEAPGCQKTVRDVAAAVKVQFDFASASIQDERALQRVASSLKTCPKVHVRVEGHSDSNGDINRNQRLSENRAQTVAEFLVGSGVAAERVKAIGFGETRPLVTNDSEANRARNRRIEIVVE